MDMAELRIEGLGPPLQPSDVLVLLGEDAAPLLHGLAGFGAATRAAFLGDRPLAGLAPHRRGLGTVLRAPGLLPGLTVAANIAWPLRLRRVERAARVAGALAALELDALVGRAAATLAPAEARRVAIARALATQPVALLLEEPFAELAAPEAEALALLLRQLGPAVVLASSDAGPALTAADRVAVLHQGRLLQLAPPREAYARPAEALVASLTGETNFLPGTVAEVFDDECRVALDGGGTVEAMLGAELPPGARCRVMLRPESLAVAAVAPEAMGEGALAATLREAVFQGGQMRLTLALANGQVLLARRPTGLRLPALGEACAVGWNTGQALVFPA
jgi:putative spermidine/putrescine transport system ATP-binding protein